MFQLTENEWNILRSQNATSTLHGGRRHPPYVFTEQGVAGLSGVLKSKIAGQIHVSIMRAFVVMRKIISDNQLVLNRLDKIERKQFETDQKFEEIFNALGKQDAIPSQGIFYDGQVFDAYEFVSKIIRSAKQSITLIDNYIDETTLTHLSKKKKDVKVLLLTKSISKQLQLDIRKANEQYGNFAVKVFTKSHDRFLIIDDIIYSVSSWCLTQRSRQKMVRIFCNG